MHQTISYQCDYCKEINISKRNMRRHERRCHLDPANQSCATCVHLETGYFNFDVYKGDGEVDSLTRKGPWCAAKESRLKHLQTKCDKWAPLPNGGASAYFEKRANYN